MNTSKLILDTPRSIITYVPLASDTGLLKLLMEEVVKPLKER